MKAVYCHPAYLTSMQSTSCEMPGWMKHKLESRLLRSLQMYSMKYAHTSLSHSIWFEHIYVTIGIKNKIPKYVDLIHM